MIRFNRGLAFSFVPTTRPLTHLTPPHRSFDVTGSSLIEAVSGPWPTPPTAFKLNKFTYPYQEFVDTYVAAAI